MDQDTEESVAERRERYFARLRARLAEEFRLLRAAIAAADREEKVPSCPEWTADQLAHRVAQTYLHKVECIRLGAFPQDWPPKDLDPDPVGVLDDGFAALSAAFDAHLPGDAAATWHGPDQTVGFWIRRMCQETVVHRVDAELVAGLELAPIPDEVALDGVDEFLDLFLGYLSRDWPEHFADVLEHADPRPVLIRGGGREWSVQAGPEGVSVNAVLVVASEGAAVDTVASEEQGAALIEGEPPELLLWLWGRVGDSSVRQTGEAAVLDQFQALRRKAVQG